MLQRILRFWADDSGQGMVEYGLIIALVAIVLIGALVALNGGLSNIFNKASTCLNNTASGTNC